MIPIGDDRVVYGDLDAAVLCCPRLGHLRLLACSTRLVCHLPYHVQTGLQAQVSREPYRRQVPYEGSSGEWTLQVICKTVK
jgi:hypothetical protein